MQEAGYTEYKLIVDGAEVCAGRVEGVEPRDLTKGNHWIAALRDLGDKANVTIKHDGCLYYPTTDLLSNDTESETEVAGVITYGAHGCLNYKESVKIIRL